jgi:RimJ/RimL family protein N-acetyltransferase
LQPLLHSGLELRPFEDRDADAFTAAVLESVETVGRWMPWCHGAYTSADALAWFAACRSALQAGTAFELGIFSAEDHTLLGGAGLNQINNQHAMCNLGYWVRQSRHRQGIASRTVQALLPLAFTPLALQRVEIVVAEDNHASVGVARKAGAQFECLARNRLQIHGKAVAASVFSLIP